MNIRTLEIKPTENDGQWFSEDGEALPAVQVEKFVANGGTAFLVRSLRSHIYRDSMQSRVESYGPIIKRGGRPGSTAEERAAADRVPEEIANKLAGEILLLDWKGLKDGEDELPFKRETAIMLCEKYPEFRKIIRNCATGVFLTEEENKIEAAQALGNA